jgi:5-methyltetrahydrofolate--homocysteine methyltransferase
LSDTERDGYISRVRQDYARVAEGYARGQQAKRRSPIDMARRNKVDIDWSQYIPQVPSFTGTRVFKDVDLAEIRRYIDWTPFFSTWEMKGQYPRILNDDKYGEAARSLFDDAQALLDQIVQEKWLTANGIIGFWPANSVGGDDIEIYTGDDRKERRALLHSLRQQIVRDGGRANTALADFIAPKETGLADYIGGFAVTTGLGQETHIKRFEEAHDDYSKIMLQALSDRLAEAFAEMMHEKVRKELWAYAPDEAFSAEDLIAEKYQGIRPAPGYPAQPDHTEKPTLFGLLDAEKATGIKLTESYAMWPASSVSGLYFSNPKSHYFGVGKIERDQIEDYAKRKGWSIEKCEKWLAPILNYDPRKIGTKAA